MRRVFTSITSDTTASRVLRNESETKCFTCGNNSEILTRWWINIWRFGASDTWVIIRSVSVPADISFEWITLLCVFKERFCWFAQQYYVIWWCSSENPWHFFTNKPFIIFAHSFFNNLFSFLLIILAYFFHLLFIFILNKSRQNGKKVVF